ncbi:tetratricopeptide repeat protein [Micromonospora sp. DT48]|uniref:tetratricopeptide repeat protein n=1 Tax=unclassified Micromonospora TaxID=2617518 RepID=UPI0013285C7E|nr:tetratricopeptide repeat protein [Micromonospora sp. CP22]MTK01002.1 tetratricopeptide repeat protein [Micromonospora sp. CP22]
MAEGTDDRALPATEELTLARRALDAGELAHAADHVAAALARAPTLPEVHETLARLAATSGDGGLGLFPLQHHTFVGAVVARAHLLAAAGRPAEGLDLLVAATAHAPGADWAAVPWVTSPELAERLGPEEAARVLMQVCAAVADPVPPPNRAALSPYLTLARNAITVHPEHPLLLGTASALARRLGEVPLAVRWASRGVRAAPSKMGEVWLGYALRSAGRTREALAALRRAVGHDPDDLAVYADIAGTLADHGRLAEALDWIERALARNPSFDCAVHTAHRLRFQRDGSVDHLVALADFIRDHPDDSHEHGDLAECCRGRPWLGQVTPPASPTASVDGQAAESASGRPTPPPPSAEAARRLRELAHPAWPHPPAAYDAAVGLATLDLADLLGLLAHPPEPPQNALGRVLSGQDPALWLRCVQVWTCLGLLHHRTDEPWAESTRRRVLVELAQQPEAVAEAALFALVTAAWVDPSVRSDVAALVTGRLVAVTDATRQPTPPNATSVAHLALATPGLDPEAVALARKLAGVTASQRRGALRALLRRLLPPWRSRPHGSEPGKSAGR